MTATLPSELRDVFARSTTAELITIDDEGRPHARSVAPAYHEAEGCIDIALDERVHEPRVALLFADRGPMVLVQGTGRPAEVLHVRPERVYAWPGDDPDGEPRLFDAHMEEVRSGHNEEPVVGHLEPDGGSAVWDARLEALDAGLLACVGPDGFPFAARVTVDADAGACLLRLADLPVGMPLEPGPACLHATGSARVEG